MPRGVGHRLGSPLPALRLLKGVGVVHQPVLDPANRPIDHDLGPKGLPGCRLLRRIAEQSLKARIKCAEEIVAKQEGSGDGLRLQRILENSQHQRPAFAGAALLHGQGFSDKRLAPGLAYHGPQGKAAFRQAPERLPEPNLPLQENHAGLVLDLPALQRRLGEQAPHLELRPHGPLQEIAVGISASRRL